MAQQMSFDWPTGVALAAEDFFVSLANEAAFAMISDPDHWPERKLVLVGPEASGKSHLARVFAAATGAEVRKATDLGADLHPDGPVVVEDADRVPPDAEEDLFHLHNNLRAAGLPLLLTARTAPGRWPLRLPDLASRMQASAIATIGQPDDALLEAVLMKHFADRQLAPTPSAIRYLLPRIERTFAAVAQTVARIDAAALAAQKPVTRSFVRELV